MDLPKAQNIEGSRVTHGPSVGAQLLLLSSLSWAHGRHTTFITLSTSFCPEQEKQDCHQCHRKNKSETNNKKTKKPYVSLSVGPKWEQYGNFWEKKCYIASRTSFGPWPILDQQRRVKRKKTRPVGLQFGSTPRLPPTGQTASEAQRCVSFPRLVGDASTVPTKPTNSSLSFPEKFTNFTHQTRKQNPIYSIL